MTESVVLVCPHCQMVLAWEEGFVHCQQCGGQWPVVEGVPHFISDAPYWGELDRDRMIMINKRIKTGHWPEVLMADSSDYAKKAREMLMNPDRANWHMLLKLSKESIVLDVGAGVGAITEAMASFYRHVIAVEPVHERIVLMKERFRQEGLHNISLVRSDVVRLPLLPGSIDLAILNGILASLPWSDPDANPRAVQVQVLRKMYDLLRPGGYLCVGIENRWLPDYFLGANDLHAEIPYVTILPRFFANWYARWRIGQPYRNYLYSAPGYRRLLQEAGFSDIQVYCAVPSYNQPSFIVPFDRQLFGYYQMHFNAHETSRGKRFVLRLLRDWGLDKYLAHSFFIIGRKRLLDM